MSGAGLSPAKRCSRSASAQTRSRRPVCAWLWSRRACPSLRLQVPADPQDPRSPAADAAYLSQKVALQYDGHTHFDQGARDGFRRTVTEVRRTLAAREAVPA
ncbi:hypothetical protein GCM10009618_03400 [Nesterenkonia lacusekhoensis]